MLLKLTTETTLHFLDIEQSTMIIGYREYDETTNRALMSLGISREADCSICLHLSALHDLDMERRILLAIFSNESLNDGLSELSILNTYLKSLCLYAC